MKRNKKGFTIVELVIVIGVIGILYAILIPTFVILTDRANSARAKEEVSGAYSAYLVETNDAKPLTQKEVAIEYKEEGNFYTFGNDGWAKPAEALSSHGALVYFVDVNGNGGAYEVGTDIGVYKLAA